MSSEKSVLIAHQSSIPHYRVPFYQSLERLRPDNWRFDVVYDYSEQDSPIFFKEKFDFDSLGFPTVNTKTRLIQFRSKRIAYQPFIRQAKSYDLVVVENAINNLSYPLCHLLPMGSTKRAFWGHDKDRNLSQLSPGKRLAESLKMHLVKHSDGFFCVHRCGCRAYDRPWR